MYDETGGSIAVILIVLACATLFIGLVLASRGVFMGVCAVTTTDGTVIGHVIVEGWCSQEIHVSGKGFEYQFAPEQILSIRRESGEDPDER